MRDFMGKTCPTHLRSVRLHVHHRRGLATADGWIYRGRDWLCDKCCETDIRFLSEYRLSALRVHFRAVGRGTEAPNALHREACADGHPLEELPRSGAGPRAGDKSAGRDSRLG